MSPERLFVACTAVACAGWLLLLVAPERRPTRPLARVVIPALLCGVYALALATAARDWTGGFHSLDAVARLFSHRWALLAGWIHFLAFDLLVGAWIEGDARARGLGRPARSLLLVLTCLAGPLGLLAYLPIRPVIRHDD